MLALVRSLQILFAVFKFRLDTFIRPERLPWFIRWLFWPLVLLPEPETSRGQRLCGFFEHMGPVFVKFGQLLSTRPDLVPPDLVQHLDKLQDDVAPFLSKRFITEVETALGGSVDHLFKSFDPQPLASASVAQVHSAVLPDGKEVVVKALRPGLTPVIEKDIALLRILAGVVQRLSEDGRRLHLPEVVVDYRTTVLDELDLLREAANASQLRRNFDGSSLLYVPEIHWPYCRKNVIVMERIYGIPVTDIRQLKAQDTDMKRLAERGVEIFFTQVFEH